MCDTERGCLFAELSQTLSVEPEIFTTEAESVEIQAGESASS